uniref:Uncharacterized protein n=1 Tax=Rhizophora mucronata TaxID=61149 RepID=A0A2P2JK33_RHIMU
MAKPSWLKKRQNLTLFLLLVLVLLAILLFGKGALQAPLSLYGGSFTRSNAHVSSPAAAEPVDDPTISPISEGETVLETSTSAESIDGEFNEVNKKDPVPDFVSLADDGADKLGESVKDCDLYMGTWVRDEAYPLYKPISCPYVDEAFDCQSNGRQDSDYLKWRWKPHACDLPRFNATDFLTRLRGKRLMMVGDSMNRNQFESMLCVLREGLGDKNRMHEIHGHKITKGRGYYVFEFVVIQISSIILLVLDKRLTYASSQHICR